MVKVYLMLRKGRTKYECQWSDPITGRLKTKSTGTSKRREAERFAGALESQINTGEHEDLINITWKAAADRYENEVMASRAETTLKKFKTARKSVEKFIDPKFLRAVNTDQISRLQSSLRSDGLAEATIKSVLSGLRSFLNWSHRMGMLPKAPLFQMPKRTAKMKHRPITTEEYERMLACVEQVASKPLSAPWIFMLKGLWTSGLRLDEALRLRWDSGEITVNLTGTCPRLKIEANADKSTKARLLPIAPEFAELLLSVPPSERHGRVFRVVVPGQVADMRLDTCSKFITRIGKKANVCVAERSPSKDKAEPRKSWAGAHCFRRAFGTRWAKRLRPQQLQDLMRHESISTTMTFYVEDDIRDVESAVWSHATNTSANNGAQAVSQNQKT